MVCRALRSVVVETWVDCWAAELRFRWPWKEEVVEYMDIRLLAAMVCVLCVCWAGSAEQGDRARTSGPLASLSYVCVDDVELRWGKLCGPKEDAHRVL